MDPAFSTAIPNPSLAAIAQLSENSRLGFASRNTTLHQGIEWSKSTLALGLPEWSGKTASDPVVAANNGLNIGAAPHLPWYKNPCVTSALGAGALSVGIDSIGLIPEAGGLARVIGHQAGYVGVVADQLGSRVVGAVGASTSTVNGLAGLGDTSTTGLLSTGLTIAGFVPGLGQGAAIGSILVDTYKTAKAIGQCH